MNNWNMINHKIKIKRLEILKDEIPISFYSTSNMLSNVFKNSKTLETKIYQY